MARGLPKKYAKMGFKKGWREYKKTPGYRRAHGMKPLKGGSKPSGRPSNPAGGHNTTTQAKIGLWFRKLRTLFNFTAPGLSVQYRYPTMGLRDKANMLLRHYTGFYIQVAPKMHWDPDSAIPSWQGMAVSAVNDWVDRKTRTSAKISRGKIVHILKEALPVLQAHYDASIRYPGDSYSWVFANAYNKYTTGYSLMEHDWDGSRLTPYITAKLLAVGYDYLVPTSIKRGINRLLPKGVNPA